MKENIKNLNVLISYWLLITTLLVALIIIVGGLTRLTDSGLSITRWDLFSGILPPLTQADWKNYFELYKKIPEFQLVNFNMTLDEFKVIFLWEYAHRLLGRVVGLFYLIPLIIFLIYSKINFENFTISKRIFILFSIILFFFTLPLFHIAEDWSRWFSIHFHLISLFIFYLYNKRIIHNTSLKFNKFNKFLLRKNFIPLFIIILFFYSTSLHHHHFFFKGVYLEFTYYKIFKKVQRFF